MGIDVGWLLRHQKCSIRFPLHGSPKATRVKVAQVNFSDGKGGAARAAARLHLGLRATGVDSDMLVMERSGLIPHVERFIPSRQFRRRADRYLYRKRYGNEPLFFLPPSGFEIFSLDRCLWGADLIDQLEPYDLVNLHWIRGMFDYRAFFAAIAGQKPLVWTLHDMNPFTGGCHYDEKCGRFESQCGACPQLQSSRENDLTRQIWNRKQQAFSNLADTQLTIITPSRWLASECRRSSLLGRFRVETIPYGLDLEQYQPRDPMVIRQLFDIPESAFVVLALADGFGARRKGFQFLTELIQQLHADTDIYFLLVGAAKADTADEPRVRYLPSSPDDRYLSFVYSAADLFVMPSLADNLPNTIMESIACGIPVVAFDVGGVPDMVRPGETGGLVPAEDVDGLAREIRQLRDSSELLHKMKQACRITAEREFPLELQGRRYGELYRRMMTENRDVSRCAAS